MTVAEIASGLRPLLLMMSSNQPGEVFAAARQIDKRLRRAGLDWHDLADALGAGAAPAVTELRRTAAGAATCWAEVLEFLAERAEDMALRDQEFVASMRDLIRRGFHPTEKQARWLRGLFARTGGEWATEEAA